MLSHPGIELAELWKNRFLPNNSSFLVGEILSLREAALEKVFEANWPRLQEKLNAVAKSSNLTRTPRSERELLEETLQIVRSLQVGKSPIYQDRNLKSIIDFWLDKYAKSKKIDADMYGLARHEDQVYEYIIRLPEIKLIFGQDDSLRRRIKERIPPLSPY